MIASSARAGGAGSSFRISDSKLATAYHVVEGVDTVHIKLADFTCEAQVIHTDPSKDLSIIEATEELPNPTIFNIARTSEVEVAREVFVTGYPLATDIMTIHSGQISAYGLARDFPLGRLPIHEANCSLIQIQSAINRGFSGGPVLNMNLAMLSDIFRQNSDC